LGQPVASLHRDRRWACRGNALADGASLLANAVDAGSSTQFDALLDYAFAETGTYAVEVINWLGPKTAVDLSLGLPRGVSYDLNLSVQYHDVARFVFAPAPVLEDEGQQNQTLPLSNGGRAQDIGGADSWFTFDNPNIGNGTIDSNMPYATVRGSGDGSYDEYRFVITPEMLSASAGTSTGTLEAGHTYYTSARVTLNGPVGKDDLWTIKINGKAPGFIYTALAEDTLEDVAAGMKAEFDRIMDAFPVGNTKPTFNLEIATDDATSLVITDPNGFWLELEQNVASAGTITRILTTTTSTAAFTTAEITLSGTPNFRETWSLKLNSTTYSYVIGDTDFNGRVDSADFPLSLSGDSAWDTADVALGLDHFLDNLAVPDGSVLNLTPGTPVTVTFSVQAAAPLVGSPLITGQAQIRGTPEAAGASSIKWNSVDLAINGLSALEKPGR
jgi:hypothetical protein